MVTNPYGRSKHLRDVLVLRVGRTSVYGQPIRLVRHELREVLLTRTTLTAVVRLSFTP